MKDRIATLEGELIKTAESLEPVAERLERNLGTAGGIIVAGLLINDGLHAVAEAIKGVGDVMGQIDGSIEKVANAILRIE